MVRFTASSSHPPAGEGRLAPRLAALFFAIIAATYVVNAADRLIFPVALRPIGDEYGFTLGQSGLLATIYLLGLGIGGIGSGYLLDVCSRKWAIIAGIAVYSIFTILTAFAFGFADLALYRTMTGIGEGVQSVAFVIAIGAYYPRTRTFAIALIQCALGIGQFSGPRLAAALLTATGDWRMPFYGFGAAGLLGGFAMLFVSKRFTEEAEATPARGAVGQMPAHLWNANVVLVLCAIVLRSFPFFALLGLYATYLTAELHFSLTQAAAALSLFGLGPFFSPLAGAIADRVNQKPFQIVSLAVMSATGFLIFNAAVTPLGQDALALIEGIAGAFVYVNGYSLAQRCVKPSLIARVSGYYYAASTFPAAVSGFLMARLVDAFGWRMGGTLMTSVLLLVPIGLSLLIDTRRLHGTGLRTAAFPGAADRTAFR